MDMARMRIIVATMLISAPFHADAQDNVDQIRVVVQSIRQVCEAPSEPGKFWKVSTSGEAGGKVRVKLIGVVNAKGTVDFSKGEWEGVQRVLQEQQAQENARYRDCAEKLTPMFLEKVAVPQPEQQPPPPKCESVVDIRSLGWRSGHKTKFCQARNYDGNFNPFSEYSTGGYCYRGDREACEQLVRP